MSSLSPKQASTLRRIINENLRVEKSSSGKVNYIDVSNSLDSVLAKQSHVIFGRRGCGKSLLLHHSTRKLDAGVDAIYLNCEDFKHHSFPNMLIEILARIFGELETRSATVIPWGKKKGCHRSMSSIRTDLVARSSQPDEADVKIISNEQSSMESAQGAKVSGKLDGFGLSLDDSLKVCSAASLQLEYARRLEKAKDLNLELPRFKESISQFFEVSDTVSGFHIQLDDFYHLPRRDQPFVADYLHRLCKDLPLFFKIATLRHSSTLYAEMDEQPIGIQERHDFQPVNVDFTFRNFEGTAQQNREVLHEFARLSLIRQDKIDGIFKGEGFSRLILAGGGVPRDCLSLFLELLAENSTDGRIGKDDVRNISRKNFERRIDDLKQDSRDSEQDTLIRGIYVLRKFCLDNKSNIMMVSEQDLRDEDEINALFYRLLDYRIVHDSGGTLTHKHRAGTTFQAFAIDIGCYANMRQLKGRFREIDLSDSKAREQMRSAPILTAENFRSLWSEAPKSAAVAQSQILSEETYGGG